MWSERGTDSNNVPGRPDPDGLGGYVRIHEGAELILHGARPCLRLGLARRPGVCPCGTRLRDLTFDTAQERVRRVPLVLDLPAHCPARSTASPLDD